MILAAIFWVLLILAVLGVFAPPEPWGRYIRGIDLVLIAILGFRVFHP
jgi:hypothetical protein